jgi:hypothetical protein
MIIEYKAPSIHISQKTFDQIMRYNHCLKVPWLIVSNGLQHFCCRIDGKGNGIFVPDIPEWKGLETAFPNPPKQDIQPNISTQ